MTLEESQDEEESKTERFHEKNLNKYDISADLAEYTSKYRLEKVNTRKRKLYSFFFYHPVPNNKQEMNKLGSFMLDILKGKDKDVLLKNILQKLTRRRRDVYRFLGRIWSYLKEINISPINAVKLRMLTPMHTVKLWMLILVPAVKLKYLWAISICNVVMILQEKLKERLILPSFSTR